MILHYHGQSEFLLETAQGARVLFDPFDEHMGIPSRRVRADAVCVSHQHADHNYTQKVDGKFTVMDTPGRHSPLPGVAVTGFPAWHDDAQGKKRGPVVCFRVQADGLSVLHLGDLGEIPGEAWLREAHMPDVLLVPVGGFYTIDAAQAAHVVSLLRPRVVIPMHYRTAKGGPSKIDTLEPFLSAMLPLAPSRQPLLRLTREDLSEQPRFVVLEAQ